MVWYALRQPRPTYYGVAWQVYGLGVREISKKDIFVLLAPWPPSRRAAGAPHSSGACLAWPGVMICEAARDAL